MPGPAEIAHGPMFIGFMLNVFLFGIMITQVYLYFTTYRNDKRWMKIFVVILVVADTANTIFDTAYLYRSLIVYFGDVNALATADWLFATDPAITGIIASLVQLFFAWRVRILTHSWPLAVVVFLGSLSGLAGAVATSFEVGKTPRFTDFRDFKGVVIVWLVSESVTDIIITTSLVWYLNDIRRASRSLITWSIISYVTGLITSVVATLDLILFLVYPNGMHLIFNFPLCKLYTNSLMSSLNARAGWRYGSTARGTSTTSDLLHTSNGSPPLTPLSMVGGGLPLPGTLLEQREHARRFSAGLGRGAVDLGGKAVPEADVEAMRVDTLARSSPGVQRVRAPSRSLSVGCMASLARPTAVAALHKPRPEVRVQVDVAVESSRQPLERVDMGRGVTVPIMSTRSEEAGGVRGRGRSLSVCLSAATSTSDLTKVGDERRSGSSAEDLMRKLDLGMGLGAEDIGGAEVVSPSRLEAGRGPFS